MTYAQERLGDASSRGLFFGVILLGHIGFFWSLNSGLATNGSLSSGILDIIKVEAPTIITPPSDQSPPAVTSIDIEPASVQAPVVDFVEADSADASSQLTRDPSAPTSDLREIPRQITPPASDPRLPLTPPVYPAASQRLDEEGRVLLDVYVLENGLVGEVKVHRSSGYTRLDQAALQEVKRGWRLLPGTEDGTPTAMWVRLAVNFRLNKGE